MVKELQLRVSIREEKKEGILEIKAASFLGIDRKKINAVKILLSKVLQSILRNSIKSTENGHIKIESFVAHEQNMFIIRTYNHFFYLQVSYYSYWYSF